MYFYLIMKDGEVSGYLETDSPYISEYAVEISREEYEKYTQATSNSNSESKDISETLDYLPTAPFDTKLKVMIDRQEFLEDCIAEMAMQVYSNV